MSSMIAWSTDHLPGQPEMYNRESMSQEEKEKEEEERKQKKKKTDRWTDRKEGMKEGRRKGVNVRMFNPETA